MTTPQLCASLAFVVVSFWCLWEGLKQGKLLIDFSHRFRHDGPESAATWLYKKLQ